MPITNGTAIILMPGGTARKSKKRSDEHKGKSKGARKLIFTYPISTIATVSNHAEALTSCVKATCCIPAKPITTPANMPAMPDHVKARFAPSR